MREARTRSRTRSRWNPQSPPRTPWCGSVATGTQRLGPRPRLDQDAARIEELFLPFLDANGIPRGTANEWIETHAGWFECDHVWRGRHLVVELDSHAHHDSRPALERDSSKRRALSTSGWTVVAITWRQLQGDASAVAADLKRLLAAN